MLTEQDFINIEKQATALYESLELEIIEEIATRIARVGYANTVVLNDIKIAQEMGVLYQDIIKLVAEYNNISYEKVAEIFNQAGVQTLKFDDKIYTEAGLNPLPIKQSPSMVQTLNATIEKVAGNLQNLVMTTANNSQTQFYNAMNKAYMEVSTGVKSYTQSIIDTIKDISSQGAVITYPSGRNMNLESAVRMNIVTSVNQTCGKLQEMRADEMRWDLMELTAHSGARPSHAEWQGKIVSRSGQKGYLSLDDIGYGIATGFKGINCRHDWHPYYKDSSRTYTQEQLDAWENEKVKYNGKEYSKYDATQIQRRMERQIRNDKKELVGYQALLKNDDKNIDIDMIQNKFNITSNNLKQKESILNNFLSKTELNRDRSREFVNGIDRSLSQKIVQSSKKIEKNKEMMYNSTISLGKQLTFIDNNGTRTFLPKDAEITNIVEIAGENSKEFRNASKYVKLYGGKNSDWSKRVGKIESDKYIFDIHWIQGKNGILCDWKIKNKKLKGGKDS